MIELCDSRLGTTVLTSVVDNDVNVIDNIVNTHPAKRTFGELEFVYIFSFHAYMSIYYIYKVNYLRSAEFYCLMFHNDLNIVAITSKHIKLTK